MARLKKNEIGLSVRPHNYWHVRTGRWTKLRGIVCLSLRGQLVIDGRIYKHLNIEIAELTPAAAQLFADSVKIVRGKP